MIIFDTETTSLTAPEAAPIEQQPWIMEFAAIKVNARSLKEIARLQFLCKPPVPIPLESIKITGITNEMVANKPPFAAFFPRLQDFFVGERYIVAHNLSFDVTALRHEISRLGKVTAFPWPPRQICTVEKTLYMKGYRSSLGALHEELFGNPHEDAHRAMVDVEALHRCVIELRKRRII